MSDEDLSVGRGHRGVERSCYRGTFSGGRYGLVEVYRFENGLHVKDGHLCWDIDGLLENVLDGLAAAHDGGWTPTRAVTSAAIAISRTSWDFG